ncbi:unnamed protein product [Cuscuta campestris]|uniref:Uncharacterized protein n=1 Tax=Cuscuta campestris TaxID=132261 RepID=A0A484L2U2_9ASTE|nr:unnamed protein product [Cuscuta campestris]
MWDVDERIRQSLRAVEPAARVEPAKSGVVSIGEKGNGRPSPSPEIFRSDTGALLTSSTSNEDSSSEKSGRTTSIFSGETAGSPAKNPVACLCSGENSSDGVWAATPAMFRAETS